MRSDYAAAMNLIELGLPDREVVRRTAVPRSTVGRWRRGAGPRVRRASELVDGWAPTDPRLYCYVLGLYLGDGHVVARSPSSASLILSMDRRYPGIVQSAADALATLFPEASVTRYRRPLQELVLVRATHPAVVPALPQHGPGQKHTRRIELEPWQAELTALHPKPLLRGLVHSDGCRTVNRFSVRLPSGRVGRYAYPRYFFSNLSGDIRRIFVDHCALIGVRCTHSNHRNVSVSHRRSVAILDSFIGPKR